MNEPAADDIAAILTSFRFQVRPESATQNGIAEVLGHAFGDQVRREVELGPENRIDFLIGGVGLEVKVGGGQLDVLRQIQRYAAQPEITSLIIASTRAQLLVGLPSSVRGKPLLTLHLRSYP